LWDTLDEEEISDLQREHARITLEASQRGTHLRYLSSSADGSEVGPASGQGLAFSCSADTAIDSRAINHEQSGNDSYAGVGGIKPDSLLESGLRAREPDGAACEFRAEAATAVGGGGTGHVRGNEGGDDSGRDAWDGVGRGGGEETTEDRGFDQQRRRLIKRRIILEVSQSICPACAHSLLREANTEACVVPTRLADEKWARLQTGVGVCSQDGKRDPGGRRRRLPVFLSSVLPLHTPTLGCSRQRAGAHVGAGVSTRSARSNASAEVYLK
jgi:hypothetical protein